MSGFDRLCPALQVQVVNGLGWTSLRPVQDQTIDAVLDGANCVVLAPTAGGKTEAALFPVLSRAHEEDWQPTSVLYLAPIRALLNNQEARLTKLSALLGRRAFKWHGDVSASRRKRFVRDPADILAITPESLEAMLLSRSVPGKRLLSNVRAVIIDEVHAFARDDRGAHLVAILERIQRVCGHDIQRIGLSATVGDPEAIAAWLGGSSTRPATVIDPGSGGVEPDILLDYVGNIDNAAMMVERLYPRSRRLVFVDSRRRVEQLGELLRGRGVETYLSHSSLSASERGLAERAFEEADNCVIVATSALELGIDVGDLDHVIQLDAPTTVASFLQRMGRTGRRPGTRPNCTFLATKDDALLQAAALLQLHAEGYIEPTAPGRRAAHVLAHQLMALTLQEDGVEAATWWKWVEGASSFSSVCPEERGAIATHMLENDIVAEAGGRLILGDAGQKRYGGRNFLDLYAVFSTAPVLRVLHNQREIGSVDASFLMDEEQGPRSFVLGGRPWRVVRVLWKRGVCLVEPTESGRAPRWSGTPSFLSGALCGAMRRVLVSSTNAPCWSRRATAAIEELRAEHEFLHDEERPLLDHNDRLRWWTFAGGRRNNLLARVLQQDLGAKVTASNLWITFSEGAAQIAVAVRQAIVGVEDRATRDAAVALAPDERFARVSKFQLCLPEHLSKELIAQTTLEW